MASAPSDSTIVNQIEILPNHICFQPNRPALVSTRQAGDEISVIFVLIYFLVLVLVSPIIFKF